MVKVEFIMGVKATLISEEEAKQVTVKLLTEISLRGVVVGEVVVEEVEEAVAVEEGEVEVAGEAGEEAKAGEEVKEEVGRRTIAVPDSFFVRKSDQLIFNIFMFCDA